MDIGPIVEDASKVLRTKRTRLPLDDLGTGQGFEVVYASAAELKTVRNRISAFNSANKDRFIRGNTLEPGRFFVWREM